MPDPIARYQRALAFQQALQQAFGQAVFMPQSIQRVLLGGPDPVQAQVHGDLTPQADPPATWVGPTPDPLGAPSGAGVSQDEINRRQAMRQKVAVFPDAASLLAAQGPPAYQSPQPTYPGSSTPQAQPLQGAELASPQWNTGQPTNQPM